MKRTAGIILIIFLFSIPLLADDVGKIVRLNGIAERFSIATGVRFDCKLGTVVKKAQKIRTGPDSMVEVLLKDGSTVKIMSNSCLSIIYLRIKEPDPPSRINLDYGMIKFFQKRNFRDVALILSTPSAAISNVEATFGVITSKNTTKVLVYSKKLGIASSNRGIKKAFVAIEKQEVTIELNRDPSDPVDIPATMINSWFDYYMIVDNNFNIIRLERDEGFVDWLLRRREL